MDLKNIDLKNIKFDEIISKIKTIEKKVLIKIGIGVGSVVVFLIIYYAILSPIVEKKKIQLEDMNVKPKVSAALESALFILLFDAMISHITPTIIKTGINCAITLSTISFYSNNATKTRTQFLENKT